MPKKKKPVEVKQYVGIVDTLGLDSFAPFDSKTAFHMKIRAMANPQRHACMFLVDVPAAIDVEGNIRKTKDPWDMWAYVQMVSTEMKCQPNDAKTIKNIKKLADSMVACTGSARGF